VSVAVLALAVLVAACGSSNRQTSASRGTTHPFVTATTLVAHHRPAHHLRPVGRPPTTLPPTTVPPTTSAPSAVPPTTSAPSAVPLHGSASV